ncbi:MAG: homocitrate synthase, partial [Chloroflexi bacterium]|nr:homocitrate synthase [Chloroflexota bacterium]
IEALVARKLGITIPFNTPITGDVAFHHKAGVHTKAVLQNPTTYEAINPEDFGMSRFIDVAHHLVGRNAIRDRASTLGLDVPEAMLRPVTTRVKALADLRPITIRDVDDILYELVHPVED